MERDTSSKKKTTFILGAGFSKCADVPVQAEISPLFISAEFDSPIDTAITGIIKDFMKNIFGWQDGRDIPSPEDIFTFIDLSIGNGHYLGAHYSADKLRALRRILIYRIFQILDKKFRICPDIIRLLQHYQNDDCSFVVVNWDIVLEKHLLEIDPDVSINYISPTIEWDHYTEGIIKGGVKICKMHGSGNWVYCENCKILYFQADRKLSLHKKVGVQQSDFRLFDTDLPDELFSMRGYDGESRKDSCRKCHNPVASHIATMSFRKSFRTAAYSSIWYEAENLLADADHWVFIGYSLPEADFEFKHLIKSAEHRYPDKKRRKTDAVIYQDDKAKDKFERFFGCENVTVYENGLEEYVEKFKKEV